MSRARTNEKPRDRAVRVTLDEAAFLNLVRGRALAQAELEQERAA